MYCINNSIFVSNLPSWRLSDVVWGTAPVGLYKQVKAVPSFSMLQLSTFAASSTLRTALLRAHPGHQAFIASKLCARNYSNFRKSPSVLEALRLRSVKSWTRSEFLEGSRFFRSESDSVHQGKESSISWRRFGTTAVGRCLRCFVIFYICIGWSRSCGSCSWRNSEQGYTGSFKCRRTFVSQWQLQVHGWWPACHRSCCEADLQVRFCVSIDVG